MHARVHGVTRWPYGERFSVAGQVARGKVTLIDFWTYTCICIRGLRTVSYLRVWNDYYATKGLTIVGVHASEFSFKQKTGRSPPRRPTSARSGRWTSPSRWPTAP